MIIQGKYFKQKLLFNIGGIITQTFDKYSLITFTIFTIQKKNKSDQHV